MKEPSSLQKPRGQSASGGCRDRRWVTVCWGRVLCWNAAWTAVGLALIVAAGEAWCRLTMPFAESSIPTHFVHDVGMMMKPDTETYHTNNLDFWTISRTNNLGFLDRQPSSAERAANSCHVAIIGDSFVAAKQIPIADKVQVRLEDLAAQRLPQLDVTTSAYAYPGTGQINQIPYYDEYAQHMRPKLVVLVFVPNDYVNNVTGLWAMVNYEHPERQPYLTGKRNRQGVIKLRPPSVDFKTRRFSMRRKRWIFLSRSLGVLQDSFLEDLWNRSLDKAARVSHFVAKLGALGLRYPVPQTECARAALMNHSSIFHPWLDDWSWFDDWASEGRSVGSLFSRRRDLPRAIERALDYTAFSLDQFKERADHDNFRLVILSVHLMGTEGDPSFDRMYGMAETRGIPVINQHDWIVRQRGRVKDANWAHDSHWNVTGHHWAAEALLEYIERNQDVCRPGGGASNGGP